MMRLHRQVETVPKLRLSVRVLPWDQPNSEIDYSEQLQQSFRPFLHPCFPYLTVSDLCHELPNRFRSVFPSAGELRIKCLETDNGDILDGDLVLSDCFDYREKAGPSSWTVCVRREPPTLEELRLLGNIRFTSILTNSGARPPKRPHDEVSGIFGIGGQCGPAKPAAFFKRQRKELGTVERTFQQNEPIASIESTVEERVPKSPSNAGQEPLVPMDDVQRLQHQDSYHTPQSMQAEFVASATNKNSQIPGTTRSPDAQAILTLDASSQNDAQGVRKTHKREPSSLRRIFSHGQISKPSPPEPISEVEMDKQDPEFQKPQFPASKLRKQKSQPQGQESAMHKPREAPKQLVGGQTTAISTSGLLLRPGLGSVVTGTKSQANRRGRKPKKDIFEIDTDTESSQELPPSKDVAPQRSSLGLKNTSRKSLLSGSKSSDKQSADVKGTHSRSKSLSPSNHSQGHMQEPHEAKEARERLSGQNSETMDVDEPEDSLLSKDNAMAKTNDKGSKDGRTGQNRTSEASGVQSEEVVLEDKKLGSKGTRSKVQRGEKDALVGKSPTPAKRPRERPRKISQEKKPDFSSLNEEVFSSAAKPKSIDHVATDPGRSHARSAKATAKTKITDMASILNREDAIDTRPQTPKRRNSAQRREAEDSSPRRSTAKTEEPAKKISGGQRDVRRLSEGLTTTLPRNKSLTPHVPGRQSNSRLSTSSRSVSSVTQSVSPFIAQHKEQGQTPSRATPDSLRLPEPVVTGDKPKSAQRPSSAQAEGSSEREKTSKKRRTQPKRLTAKTDEASAEGVETSEAGTKEPKSRETKAGKVLREGKKSSGKPVSIPESTETKVEEVSVEGAETSEGSSTQPESIDTNIEQGTSRSKFYSELLASFRKDPTKPAVSESVNEEAAVSKKPRKRSSKNNVNKAKVEKPWHAPEEPVLPKKTYNEPREYEIEDKSEPNVQEQVSETTGVINGTQEEIASVVEDSYSDDEVPSKLKSTKADAVDLEEEHLGDSDSGKSVFRNPPDAERKGKTKSYSRSPARVVPKKASEAPPESASDSGNSSSSDESESSATASTKNRSKDVTDSPEGSQASQERPAATANTQTLQDSQNLRTPIANIQSSQASSVRPNYFSKYPSLSQMKESPTENAQVQQLRLPPYKMPLERQFISQSKTIGHYDSTTDGSTSSDEDNAKSPTGKGQERFWSSMQSQRKGPSGRFSRL